MNTKYAVTTTYYDDSIVKLFETLTEATEYANGNACNLDSHSTVTLEKYELEGEILTANDRIDSGKSRNAWHNYFINVEKVGFINEYDEFEELDPTESQEIAGYECKLVYSDGCEVYDTEKELHEANDCYNYITF